MFQNSLTMSSFLQKVFNKISLLKNERLWMSNDDRLTVDRIKLLAEFEDTLFQDVLGPASPGVRICRKNYQIARSLLDKANLQHAQANLDNALVLLNQSLQFGPQDMVAEAFYSRATIWMDLKR